MHSATGWSYSSLCDRGTFHFTQYCTAAHTHWAGLRARAAGVWRALRLCNHSTGIHAYSRCQQGAMRTRALRSSTLQDSVQCQYSISLPA